ncbi:methyl-accepting chemotaxis protein [Sphingomonas sanguinis]|uniref:Methyl-accepting chemotaxis protein n=1 Tax=Sphingomonas sanguinis TaxID=33051 RepID=A0ABU5LMH0_9SPHN|nr:methyl-accepting chemotaxis protein [Sphingomonas sanguinis]MDZ7281133.1 methyl-accepting chemotaxis protein [Sphingomonas sanguinis]
MVSVAFAAIVLLVLVSGAASVWSNSRQAEARTRITEGSALLRNHMTADMMHDSVRGDVLSILRAVSAGDVDLAESRKSLADDAAVLRKAVLTDAAYAAAPDVVAQAKRIQTQVDAYIEQADAMARTAATDQARAAASLPAFLKAFDVLEGGMSTLSDAIEAHVAAVNRQAAEAARFANIMLAVTTFATFALIVMIAVATRRHIVAPLLMLIDALRRMTSGQMDVPVTVTGRQDELGQLADATVALRDQLAAAERAKQEQTTLIVDSFGAALTRLAEGDLLARVDAELAGPFARIKSDFNAAVANLQATLATVKEAVSGINNGASDIRQASDDLSQRTEQQAASLEETSAAMDEVTSTVRETAAGANRANVLVSETRVEAEQSGDVVRRTVEAMSGIERASTEIGEIISVIDGIAFQTNLLALNAGVEAARAGDAGKGFAVVASEVRALAQRSADAAKDVKVKITASSEQVEAGAALVSETGKALQRIIARIGEISVLVETIAASAERQATGLQQVNTAVSEMDGVTQQNAAMVEEATAAARSLAEEADSLARQVARFTLDHGPRSQSSPTTVHALPLRTAAKAGREIAHMARQKVANGSRGAMVEAAADDWSEF